MTSTVATSTPGWRSLSAFVSQSAVMSSAVVGQRTTCSVCSAVGRREGVVEPVENDAVGHRPVHLLAVHTGTVGVLKVDDVLRALQRVEEVLGVARGHVRLSGR